MRPAAPARSRPAGGSARPVRTRWRRTASRPGAGRDRAAGLRANQPSTRPAPYPFSSGVPRRISLVAAHSRRASSGTITQAVATSDPATSTAARRTRAASGPLATNGQTTSGISARYPVSKCSAIVNDTSATAANRGGRPDRPPAKAPRQRQRHRRPQLGPHPEPGPDVRVLLVADPGRADQERRHRGRRGGGRSAARRTAARPDTR